MSYTRLSIIFFTLVYLVIGSNYSFLPDLGYYDAQRLFLVAIQILAIIILAFSLIFDTKSLNFSCSLFTVVLFIILVLTLIISTAANPNSTLDLTEIFNLLALFVVVLMLAQSSIQLEINNYQVSTLITVAFTLCLGLYAFIFLVSYFSALITSLSLDVEVMFHGFSNRRFFNQIQVWILPILALPLLIKLSGGNYLTRYQPLFSALLCFNIVLLVFSSARGASLALLLSSLIVVLLIKPIALRLLLKLSLLTVAAFALYWLLFIITPPYFGFTITDSIRLRTDSSYRFELWLICLNMMKQSPLFGIGPMGFAAIPNEFSLSHPHNSVLQLAAEWGLIATAIVLFFYTKGLMAFWRLCLDQSVATERRMYRVSLLWSFLAASIYSLFSGVIVMPMSQLLGATIIGLMLAEYRSSKIASPQQVITLVTPIRSVLAIAFLVFAILYAWLIWPQLSMRMGNDPSYISNLTNIGPRFWQEGGIPLSNK